MARPKKEGMDYFPHDTDAVNDKKIEALRMLYGNDGYAFYFIILEMIYKETTFELDVSDAETIQILARKIAISEEKFNQILQTAIKRDCFDSESYLEYGILTSNGIKKRANVVVEKREKMREYHKNKHSEKELVSDAETPPESTQSKVKKRKVKEKESKEDKKIYAEFVRLSESEYLKLVEQNGEEFAQECIMVLDNYKGANNKNYASDYRAILNWVVDRVKESREKVKQFTPRNGQAQRSGKVSIPVVKPSLDNSGRLTEEEMAAAREKAKKLDQTFNKEAAIP